MTQLSFLDKGKNNEIKFHKIISRDELTMKVVDLLLNSDYNSALNANQILSIVNKNRRSKYNLTNIYRRIQTISKYAPEYYNEKKISKTYYYWLEPITKKESYSKIKKSLNKESENTKNLKNLNSRVVLKNSNDFFTLNENDLISKKNLQELIINSKVKNSKYWLGENNIIGNTPQQGINWIGKYPDIRAVIIKFKKGSYGNDGWIDKSNFNYSFKSQKEVISKTEKANKVLIDQPIKEYPVLLFTETKDKQWQFSGSFNVNEIKESHVQLIKRNSNYPEKKLTKKKDIFLANTKEIKQEFISSFKDVSDIQFEDGNPFMITINHTDYYVFLKNISPAYFQDRPDIDRIQLPFSVKFNEIIKSETPFLILGYNSICKTFTAWDPIKTKERLNNKDNISLYTRKSFQKELKLNEFNEHFLSNGDKVIIFSTKSTPQFLKKYIIYFKEKADLFSETNPKQIPKEIEQSKIEMDIEKIEMEVLNIYKQNPFLALNKFSEYMSKLKLNKKEINERFDKLINETE